MSKKDKRPYSQTKENAGNVPAQPTPPGPAAQLPKDVQEKLEAIKSKLEKFQKKILEKFDKYIVGVALMPPPKPEELQQLQQLQNPQQPAPAVPPAPAPEDKDKIHVLVLVDDSDSKTMSKIELKDKLTAIIQTIGKEIDPNITPQTLILSELWQNCFDAKYELLQLIALSAPIYDTGMLQAIKIAEVHKTMVLKKFEKYIVSYVLAGSLVQGKATPTSDIDVWIVIDDTDVKRMTRVELKDKLRAIIIGMGIEAGELTGIKNKINIQVYILTDFWDSLREANPVIFTLLRDGVPFFDRGIFMPWKQLLKMGKIKPSAEAIDIFMGSGEQVIRRVQLKLNEIGMEDIYYALLTPSQAALMLYGVAPPAPKETGKLMREIFVHKEKLLEDKFVKTLEKVVEIRKAIEHGDKKELSGKEIDDLMGDGDKYLKRIKRLFTQIEKIREQHDMLNVYDTVTTVIRDVLRLEGVEKVKENEILHVVEDKLVSEGKMPSKFLKTIQDIVRAKKDYDDGKLSKVEIEKVHRESGALIKFLVEHMQRKRSRELERLKIRVKYGEKFGEAILLGNEAFITYDLDSEEKEITKAKLSPDGRLGTLEKSSLEEMEKALANVKSPNKSSIKESIFEDLKKVFGKDVEILMSY
ncbi:MAG TPA: nucleotidyltransferase domain-containing protein [Candidatus Nanoarchaeia archaeon]|nr:nucleotidyltransferase domain-containing protein [Candidatus Nanoarchaeia archaeon]